MVDKLAAASELAQTEMAAAQQRMEEYANRYRDVAPNYRIGDKVWLDLRNISTDRPSKKLDYRYAKYTILEKVGSHAYRLNTGGKIHDVFHTALLRPASENPFPSQIVSDYQPPGVLVDGQLEYVVDRIEGERLVRRGRGHQRQYLVKWMGYDKRDWQPAANLEDTVALDK